MAPGPFAPSHPQLPAVVQGADRAWGSASTALDAVAGRLSRAPEGALRERLVGGRCPAGRQRRLV